jgi:hypothetical protein
MGQVIIYHVFNGLQKNAWKGRPQVGYLKFHDTGVIYKITGTTIQDPIRILEYGLTRFEFTQIGGFPLFRFVDKNGRESL